MIRANIIAWDSGGLTTDIDLLTEALQKAGCDVSFKGRRYRNPRNRLHSLFMTALVVISQHWANLTGRPRFDINFFDETVFPEYLPLARVNVLYVHPEWFRDENLPHLPRVDLLLCKTRDGVKAVRGLPATARYVGFTSPDRLLPGHVRSGPIQCLHVAGQSAVKGTEAVVEAWSRHPDWPKLIVVRRANRYGGEKAPELPRLSNAQYLKDFVPDEELRRLQNDCEVNVIPSLAEGYGHVIGEPMSCGVVVVTTDAPPMNELVEADRGVLVRVARTEPKDLSVLSYVSVTDLEEKLSAVFDMTSEQRRVLGRNARAWFEAQHVRFENALQELLNEIDVSRSNEPKRKETPR